MSKGPGRVEQRIADLFAATRDRALSIDDITDNAYDLGGRKPTREQRLSATRAAHRLLRRVRDDHAKAKKLIDQAHAETKAAVGAKADDRDAYEAHLKARPSFVAGIELHDCCRQIGTWTRHLRIEAKPGWRRAETDFWCTATVMGRLWFHPPDAPVRVWAVLIQPAGVIWAEAEVTRITYRNVMVRYAGDIARLDRRTLWYWWAFWRGVRFVSSRSGRIADELDQIWQERYGRATGGVPPVMQMPLAKAIELLGVPADYTKEDVIAAFRRAAKKAHPDLGGTAEMFRQLVEARDRLLAALGTSAPAPKMPAYYPIGVKAVYRASRSMHARLGSSTRYLR